MTRQERAVLTASAAGRTVAEVAALLGQTRQDVGQLLDAAMDKLDAHSKLEAIIIAKGNGSIDIDPSCGMPPPLA
jgi:DNA-binding NarL/FixJ family response regulator